MSSNSSMSRLEARVPAEVHALLKRAAEIQGRTMTDFLITVVHEAANRVIEQSEVVRLSLADQEAFANALLAPPEQAPAMQRAIERRKSLLRST